MEAGVKVSVLHQKLYGVRVHQNDTSSAFYPQGWTHIVLDHSIVYMDPKLFEEGQAYAACKHVLVEYDGVDWQRREWVAVYSRRTFRVFLVERTIVWAPRTYEGKEVKWPALNRRFRSQNQFDTDSLAYPGSEGGGSCPFSFASCPPSPFETFTTLQSESAPPADSQPVEFLHDRELGFHDYDQLEPYQAQFSARAAAADGRGGRGRPGCEPSSPVSRSARSIDFSPPPPGLPPPRRPPRFIPVIISEQVVVSGPNSRSQAIFVPLAARATSELKGERVIDVPIRVVFFFFYRHDTNAIQYKLHVEDAEGQARRQPRPQLYLEINPNNSFMGHLFLYQKRAISVSTPRSGVLCPPPAD
ncbi:hypothetical protein EVAR_84815_1 [Eumeta japonica]|uniref:Uncharacterized protein n=1 Tax=Eumeta variegata TaxID=151549 RepID=A0A4C1U863_EUMVA|nr:hypothetical protein EVAR_84815_1 [Eumeta japonica]